MVCRRDCVCACRADAQEPSPFPAATFSMTTFRMTPVRSGLAAFICRRLSISTAVLRCLNTTKPSHRCTENNILHRQYTTTDCGFSAFKPCFLSVKWRQKHVSKLRHKI